MFGWLVGWIVKISPGRWRRKLISIIPYIPYSYSQTSYDVYMKRNIKDATYWFSLVGDYGLFVENQIRSEVEKFVFIDIGANQGLFSLVASQNIACIKIYSFEPNPHVFGLFVENIKLNAASITPFCAAICSEPDKPVTLGWNPRHSGGGMLSISSANNQGPTQRNVDVIGVGRKFLGSLPIEDGVKVVVKIDVEGCEELVLEELLASAIREHIDKIIIEINGSLNGDGQEGKVYMLLQRNGYVLKDKSGVANHFDAVFEKVARDI